MNLQHTAFLKNMVFGMMGKIRLITYETYDRNNEYPDSEDTLLQNPLKRYGSTRYTGQKKDLISLIM
jgi:hypothetical protein